MNTTTTAPAKINLSRVNSGWYSFNDFALGLSFDVIKQDLGFWSVAQMDGETWMVTSLNEARALIAAKVAK